MGFVVVGVVAYLTSAAYLDAPIAPGIHPDALLARPWDLFPGALFLAAAIGFGRRPRFARTAFDGALCVSLWLNVACHSGALHGAKDISLSLAAGEIVGLAGLLGSGRSEILHGIYGRVRAEGDIRVAGEPISIKSPSDARAAS